MENRGLVDLKELRKNMLNANFRGKSAFCFINGDKIIKVYAKTSKNEYIPLDVDKLHDLSVFCADTIVFPDEYIYENGKKAGEILKYISDKSIDESFNDKVNLKKIIDSYEKVLCDLLLYSNLDMVDLCQVNILYSNKRGFHIIDTTEWVINNSLVNGNLYRFNSTLIEAVMEYLEIPIIYSRYANNLNKDFIDQLKKYGREGKSLQKSLINLMNHNYDFLGLMFALMETSRIYNKKETETFQDIKEFTKVLKKG